MSWLLGAVNWLLLTLGDAAQWVWNDGLGYVGTLLTLIARALNPLLAPLFSWINLLVNPVAGWLLAPIGRMPGWLSNTIISAITGPVLLLIFKYTSKQRAIGQVKDAIKANMLALKLFKDELSVTFRAQGRLFLGALRLLRYSLRPLAVMIVPVLLELAQMGSWYQWRPLRPGEETLVTIVLNGPSGGAMPEVEIASMDGAEVAAGPVRIPSKNEVCWQIRAVEEGRHRIVFRVGGQQVEKELVVGDGLLRVSAVRPGWDWTAIILHPLEKPLGGDCPVRSIAIDYPPRPSWASGTDSWVAYFFVVSIAFALVLKPFLKVKI